MVRNQQDGYHCLNLSQIIKLQIKSSALNLFGQNDLLLSLKTPQWAEGQTFFPNTITLSTLHKMDRKL